MEVRSEQGLMAGRDLFGMPKSPPASGPSPSPAMQSVRMAYTTDGTPVFAPVSSSAAPPAYQPHVAAHGASMSVVARSGGNGAALLPGMGEPVAKKKRGRPRKYGPDGSRSLTLVPASAVQSSSGPFLSAGSNPANPVSSVSPDGVKKRGGPKGSTNRPRIDAVGSSGVGFTPQVITVQAGEDVSAKIMSFSQHGTRTVCVLSANGAISNVTLHQTATLGGTVTYKGWFEILSMSGSFLLTDNGAHRSRTGGLSVSLAGPDGRLLGGGVAGLLIAASPIQIVVGSFNSEAKSPPKQQGSTEPTPAPLKVARTTGMGANSPPSRGALGESSGGAGSPPPIHQGLAASNNNQPTILSSMPWK